MSSEYAILETILDWHASGKPVAVATVIQTWGSAPRPAGSQMGITMSGEFVGSVSGGCVEGAIIAEAMDVLETGNMRQLEYGVTNNQAWELGLPCGGTIKIIIQIASQDLGDGGGIQISDLAELAAIQSHHKPRLLAINVETFNAVLLDENGNPMGKGDVPNLPLKTSMAAITSQNSQMIEASGRSWFLRIYNPPLRLIIVGAVHIAEHLAAITRASGYDVTLIDPRPAFATPSRFANTTIVNDWPDNIMPKLTLDARTALVALSHDPQLDDAALKAALKTPCFYIGALGSRKNQTKRLDRLAAEGFRAEQLSRIHGPVGLPIGAQSPAEIAIAIAAEMTAALRLGNAQ